jgi:hypothetical protein
MDVVKFEKSLVRLAMPVAIPEELKSRMMEQGWYIDPEGTSKVPSYLRKKDVEPAGLYDLISDTSLIKIFKPSENDIKDVDGGESFASGNFIILSVADPKTYAKVPGKLKDYVDENKVFHGSIKAISTQDGNLYNFGPINFTQTSHEETNRQKRDLAHVFHQINTQAKRRSLQQMERANQAANAWNARLEKALLQAGNLTHLPLQLRSTRDQVQERIVDLDRIINRANEVLEEAKPASIEAVEQHIDEQLASARLVEQDFKDHVLNKYYYNWEKLVSDLESGELQIPPSIPNSEDFKNRLLQLGRIAYDRYRENKELSIQPKEVTQQFDIGTYDTSQPLTQLTEQDMPYTVTTRGYVSYEGFIKDWWNKKRGSQKDKQELEGVIGGINEILEYIKDLPEGTRGERYLSTPEGQAILDRIQEICQNNFKVFIERYRTSIVDDDGKIDFKKFGPSGTAGNGLVVVALHRLWTVISKMINSLKERVNVEMGVDAVPPPSIGQDVSQDVSPEVAPSDVTSSIKRKVIKISKSQWNTMSK